MQIQEIKDPELFSMMYCASFMGSSLMTIRIFGFIMVSRAPWRNGFLEFGFFVVLMVFSVLFRFQPP